MVRKGSASSADEAGGSAANMNADQVSKLPDTVTGEWVENVLQPCLDAASRTPAANMKNMLPPAVAISIFEKTEKLLSAEPTLVEVTPNSPDTTVVVVGDTHGQFHDVCRMLEVAGRPGPNRMYVFNGDFVDRGAWGLETLVLMCSLKLAFPQKVTLLRGNHETATCTLMYGYKGELVAKYGLKGWKQVHTACKKMFSHLPLAAVINQKTLVLHGGLFRKQAKRAAGKIKRKGAKIVRMTCVPGDIVGGLDDLRSASKGGLDPSGLGASRLATDVLWSDPTPDPGFKENDARGVGMTFGPEITEQFLKSNGLSLILRSHEGPDAREDREGMGDMLEGYTLDHQTESGRLMTVFSAPDYPQFVAESADRYLNRAAVAVLSSPDYATPRMQQYEAVMPRPEAAPYYDLGVPDSDEEFEPAASDLSGMTDVRHERELRSSGSHADVDHEEDAEEVQQEKENEAAKEDKEGVQPPSPAAAPTQEETQTDEALTLPTAFEDKAVSPHGKTVPTSPSAAAGEHPHPHHHRAAMPAVFHPHHGRPSSAPLLGVSAGRKRKLGAEGPGASSPPTHKMASQ